MATELRIARGWASPQRRFDVVCAGEALVAVAPSPVERARAGGGAVSAALALVTQGFSVGLATSFADNASGRALYEYVRDAGVDTSAVSFVRPRGLVVVPGTNRPGEVVACRDDDEPIAVPDAWTAPVLLLSGLSPVIEHGAALCKAARAARRLGTIVVIDVYARREVWTERDPRAIRSVLREADVVRLSAEDLAVLGVGVAMVHEALRPSAVLVVTDHAGLARATGPFGEVAPPRAPRRALPGITGPRHGSDALTAAICAELVRAGEPGEDRIELWERALERGRALRPASIRP
jgi:sugar/nucleoside kinase (ribokinase family)